MPQYWITIEIEAPTLELAQSQALAYRPRTLIVDVQHAPPQGATIVGDMHEDSL